MAKIPVNIPVSDEEKKRIIHQTEYWTAPKLILVAAVTLGLYLIMLYTVSNLTYPYWPTRFLP